jgi:deazaflavin-dependent oxidoreductase (nitroreductase family)
MWFDPFTIWILRSPFHAAISQGAMLITYRGKKSGKQYSIPVNYIEMDRRLVTISFHQRTWWRNLRGYANVELLLRGQKLTARPQVFEDDASVMKYLADCFKVKPQYAKYLQVRLDSNQNPAMEDLEAAARARVIVLFSTEGSFTELGSQKPSP